MWLSGRQIIHLHLTYAAILGTVFRLWVFLRQLKCPVVFETYHAVGMKIKKSKRALSAWNLRLRDGVAFIALDAFWRDFINRYPELLCVHIPNGIDSPVDDLFQDNIEAFRVQTGLPETANRIIGTVGQFRADRSPQEIAKILITVLKQSQPNVHALMCGSGPELVHVAELIHKEGLQSRFTLPGLIKEPRVAMAAMSVYLTINVGEITGIAALEAALCGVPIVALQFDSCHECSDSSWIWSHVKSDEVSKRILSLLDAPEQLAAIARMQREYVVSNHLAEGMYRRYLAIYRCLLDGT